MEATRVRVRLAPTMEWLVAAIFLLATLGVAILLLRELGTGPVDVRPAPVMDTSGVPAAVPARAVSVPALLLMNGVQIRVGDTETRVSELLGASAQTGAASEDRGGLGRRLTRAYRSQGTTFLLVFEPFERDGPLRVAGIYLQ
jgi:hypothetical protein